jgi:predicted RNA-binding protein associated with RNAse of E/G family
MKEDKHIQFTLEGKDYDLILRVDDEGTGFVYFDIFDYLAQEYKAHGVIQND